MGGLPNVFTAYQPVTSPAASEKFAKAWGVETLSQAVGLTIPGMLEGLENGEVKALYIMGENPVVSDPDVNHVKKAFEKVEFLVVQDIFLTATAELADVVLPGVSFAEKDGTFSNTERRISRVRKAIEPLGESRQDWQIIQDISTRFGYQMNYEQPRRDLRGNGRSHPFLRRNYLCTARRGGYPVALSERRSPRHTISAQRENRPGQRTFSRHRLYPSCRDR